METIKRLEEQISSLEQELKIRSPNVTAQEESRSDSNSVDNPAAKLIVTTSTESSDDASPSNQPSTCVEKLQVNYLILTGNIILIEGAVSICYKIVSGQQPDQHGDLIGGQVLGSSSLSRLDWALLVEAEDTRTFLEESSNVR